MGVFFRRVFNLSYCVPKCPVDGINIFIYINTIFQYILLTLNLINSLF